MAGEHATIRRVCTEGGVPIVEKVPDGTFDVLCYGNEDGSCKGCRYNRKSRWICGAPCKDEDHIKWIHYQHVSGRVGTRIKKARFWDVLVTEAGDEFVILEDRKASFGFEVRPRVITKGMGYKGTPWRTR